MAATTVAAVAFFGVLVLAPVIAITAAALASMLLIGFLIAGTVALFQRLSRESAIETQEKAIDDNKTLITKKQSILQAEFAGAPFRGTEDQLKGLADQKRALEQAERAASNSLEEATNVMVASSGAYSANSFFPPAGDASLQASEAKADRPTPQI